MPAPHVMLAALVIGCLISPGWRAESDEGSPGIRSKRATRPGDDVWATNRPYYHSADELCDYVNAGRETSQWHDRYKGYPGAGVYHAVRTWPLRFTVDPTLHGIAQAEADRLARGGGPQGSPRADSSWRRPVWLLGINTADYQLTAQDHPGDWDPAASVASRAALINANGACRMGLFYQDPGGDGPALTRIGCGGALAADGKSRWWVVVLRP